MGFHREESVGDFPFQLPSRYRLLPLIVGIVFFIVRSLQPGRMFGVTAVTNDACDGLIDTSSTADCLGRL